MPKTILIKKRQDGKPQFLQLTLESDTLSRENGIVGGAVSGTSNTFEGVNIGKSNEKTPSEAAEDAYKRLIKTKLKEGYRHTENLGDLACLDRIEDVFLDDIPHSLCISKPTKEITESKVDEILKTGNGKFFVKYNGIGHFILIGLDGEITIFTRRWGNHTKKYPEIVKHVKSEKYPKGTLIYSEFHIDQDLRIPHMSAFLIMSRISKADVAGGVCKDEVPKSLEIQKEYRVRAALLYIIYCDNKPSYTYPIRCILNSLKIKSSPMNEGKAIFVPVDLVIESGAKAFDIVRKNKDIIEGLVLVDTSQKIEVTLNGKPNRCASWKIKSRGDADVIADGYKEGNGKHQGRIGSLAICQYDIEGNRVDLGFVGGLEQCDRNPVDWKFPCVIEVKYDQRFPDTGKFQFGVFSKRHEDKLIEEVDIFGL